MSEDRQHMVEDIARNLMFYEQIIDSSDDVRKVHDAKEKIAEIVDHICECDWQLMLDIDAYINNKGE